MLTLQDFRFLTTILPLPKEHKREKEKKKKKSLSSRTHHTQYKSFSVLKPITNLSAASLSPLSPNAPSELNILGHDGDPLGMDRAQVGVFEETNQVGLSSLLKSSHSRALEPQVGLEILSDFTDQTLKWELPDEELSALLVLSDLTESHGSGPEPVWLLHSAGGRSRLTSCLGGQLLARSFSSGGLAGGLLGTSH